MHIFRISSVKNTKVVTLECIFSETYLYHSSPMCTFISRSFSSSEFKRRFGFLEQMHPQTRVDISKDSLRHIDAAATCPERLREKKRSRFSSSENKRTPRRDASRRKQTRAGVEEARGGDGGGGRERRSLLRVFYRRSGLPGAYN